VYEAVDHYQRHVGASAGRGGYHSAQQAQRITREARAACAQLLGISSPNQLIFTSSGTASLNLAIHGLLKPGDHVVTTVTEHNSVLRPLYWQAEHNDVEITFIDCDSAGSVDAQTIAKAISPKTRLVAISHASNVTGALQPLAEIAQGVQKTSAMLLVDAAQTAGCVPLDVEQLGIDMLACGGHKGLLGPLGSGLLYLRPDAAETLTPLLQGGTGVDSQSQAQPQQLPERFEAGSLSLPAIAGIGAAAKVLQQRSVTAIQTHHQELSRRLIDGLNNIPGVMVCGPTTDQPRVAVVSCQVDGYDPQELAATLDASCGIQCRAGLHCAPRLHAALGTAALGGLVRFSPGWSTTAAEIDQTLAAITAIASTTA